MKVLIIEDENKAANLLKKNIVETDDSIEILEILDSVEASVDWLNSNPHPDLIFLDIQLSDGLSFNIFKQTDVSSPVIFTTAYDKYALDAFEINSIDYLLKPISNDKLAKSLNKYKSLKRTMSVPDEMTEINRLFANISISKNNYKSRFLIEKGDALLVVPISDIAYFLSEQKVLFVITKDGKRHIINDTLEKVSEKVDPDNFFRINRHLLVSVSSIRKIHAYFNYKLKLEVFPVLDDSLTIVSRAKVKSFKDWVSK